jgi:hypothetical protein
LGVDIHIAVEVYQDGRWRLADVAVPDDRNYWAFAILADVCNGYGFAGVDTGDSVEPISEPRGLPEDLSDELADAFQASECYLGDEPYSYLTLRELLDYDLEAPLTQRGMVSTEAAQAYREKGELPTAWCGWTSQPGFERLSWQVPRRQAAWLIPQIIETLQGLGEPDHVRIIFGFDA